jgi:iron(III) transport system permease protein
MIQVGYELEKASFIVDATWAQVFLRIVLPLMGPALIAVALLTFNSAARNVTNIVMIVSGSNRPIAMLQVDYMVDGRYERGSVVGVIIVLLTLIMIWFARGLTSGRSDKHWDLRYSRQGE